jgi:BASS family bile acid:Na+ symporter
MDAFLPLLQKASTLVFLLSSMLATGLSISPRDVLAPLRNVRLVLLLLALNFIAAPALAWLLSLCLHLAPGHAAGLLLLGCAAGAPFLPKLVEVARGDLILAAALIIFLTLGTLVFMPVALPILVPALSVDAWAIAKPLLLMIVAPLAAGMVARSWRPAFATQSAPMFSKLGNLALLMLFALLIALNFRALIRVLGSGAILAAILHFFGLFFLSWFLSSGNKRGQSVVALGTGARNFGAALVPAASATANPDTTTMLIVSAIVGLLIAFPTAKWAGGRLGTP